MKKGLKQFLNNYWAVASVLLAVLLVIVLIANASAGVSKAEAGKIVLDFAEEQGVDASLVDVKSQGSVYEVILDIEGQQVPVYITKDGNNFVPQLIPLTGNVVAGSNTQQTASGYSSEDLIILREFSNCLAEKGVKIYGANWCGYTNQWVEILGGYDVVSSVYIECTENEALCASEEITGYPTTKINGEVYRGARTIEAIAIETGCSVPVLSGSAGGSTQTASC